jgi:ABC-type sugar transport system substrate-binding protein
VRNARHRRHSLYAAVLVAAAVVVMGLVSSGAAAGRTAASSSKAGPLDGKHIVFSECCEDPMFNDSWEPGIAAAMKWTKQGGTLSTINANSDNTTQLSQIQSIIGGKTAAAVLTVTEAGSGYAPVVKSAQKAGIIWGNYAGDPAPGANLNILYPHYQAGYLAGVAAGKWLKQTQGGKGDAGTTINPNDPGLSTRTKGFVAGIKTVVPGIKFYQASASEGSVPDGAKVASQLLSTHPSIKILFCYNETLSLGCVQGASEAGRTSPKSLYIVDDDASTVGLQDMIKGNTPIQQVVTPDYEGDMAVLTAVTERAIEGKPIPHTGVANVTLIATKAAAQAELNAQTHPFAPKNVTRTLNAVRLYAGFSPPYGNSNVPKGPGMLGSAYFKKYPFS